MSVDMSWHERELVSALEPEVSSGLVVIVPDPAPLLAELWSRFPGDGDHIDWARVPAAEYLAAPVDRSTHGFTLLAPNERLREFVAGVLEANGIADSEPIVVVGDSLTRFGLRMPVRVFSAHLEDVLGIPQHTYAFAEDCRWCFHYTTGDEMFFGRPDRRRPGAGP